MLTRFAYRSVSIVFLLVACACWLLVAAALVAQYQGFNFEAFCAAIMLSIAAFMSHQLSIEAWRAARYSHPRYDY